MIRFKLLTYILVVLLLVDSGFSQVLLLLSEEYEDCREHKGEKFTDWTGMEHEMVNNSTIFLNGNLKFLKRIESPWKVHYFIEKYERLKWHTQIIDRRVPDFCAVLQSIKEPWYELTSSFGKKNCPYEAGHVETFTNVRVAKHTDKIPYNFIGKYRATMKSFFKDENGSEVIDCARVGLEAIGA